MHSGAADGSGPYKIEAEVRRGAAEIVYAAVLRTTGQPVHLAVLRSQFDVSDESLERFRADAAALSAVSHAALAPILDFGVMDGRPYLALAPVEGASLGELTRGKPHPDYRALCLGLADVADGYHTLHEAGILLGSASPMWITVTHDERFVVHDFALACPIYRASWPRGEGGQALGKPLHMAPEQMLGTRRWDRRADVYGLGATLYQALTGQPPFPSDNLHALMRAVLSQRPKPPHKVVRGVPRKLSRLALRCLEKKARNRPATAADLAATLRASA